MNVAAIGECMLELSSAGGGTFELSFGGDTLNTAVYLARLGIAVDYVTALGDDTMSDAMLARWHQEGIGTATVLRLPGRLPGLYMIERDAAGERSFRYWRGEAPARDLFDVADAALLAGVAGHDWIYLSGITLSLYHPAARERLFALLDAARQAGARVAFDGNYRPRGWASAAAARAAFSALLPRVDLALPTFEDEAALFGDADAAATLRRLRAAGVAEIVVKQGAAGCLVAQGDDPLPVPGLPGIVPVDTTAAGDSFNAGYLAARIGGQSPEEAARCGHALAARVIQHSGAVIPRAAMADLGIGRPSTTQPGAHS